MRRFVFLRLCGGFLLICVLSLMLSGIAYAQTTYTMEVGERVVSPSLSPYSSGTQVMIPFRATTEALGGIWLDVPTGTAHKAAVLNDKVLYIITGLGCQIVLPLSENIDFGAADTLDDYIAVLVPLMLNGTIPVQVIDYPIVESNGDIYLPLEVFVSALDLTASVSGSVIHFNPDFVCYQQHDSNLSFRLDVGGKMYDGEPLTWPENALQVFCDGVQVTDYMPLSYDYMYTDMQMQAQSFDAGEALVNAGSYALTVSANPNDPKYSGVGYFSFMIYPAELILTAGDETISAGDPLPVFSYEISGIVPGESKTDAIVEDPVLSVQLTDTSSPGTYEIEVSGGTAGNNYIIKGYQSGTLTILPGVQMETIQVRCVEESTGRLLQTDQQQALAGSSVTVSAPLLAEYRISGRTEQRITAEKDAVVTFYYAKIDSGADQAQESGSTVHLPYITGYTDGTFRPQNNVRRDECAAMLCRLLEQTRDTVETGNPVQFTDVPSDAWYSSAVCILASNGIITGYQDGSFRPERAVTRAEFTAMALRLAGISPNGTGSSFVDVPQTYWAAGYIRAAAEHGWITGYEDATFRPDQYISRAEAAVILNRITGRTTCTVARDAAAFSDVPAGYWAYQAIMLAANAHEHS